MTNTVIINRPLSDSEIIEVKRLAENGSMIFAFSGNEIPGLTQQIALSPEEKRQVNFEIMDEVLGFGDLTAGDKTIADSFRIDTASVWHYHKFRIYFDVCILMYFLYPIQHKFCSFDGHIWFVPQEVKPIQVVFPEVDFRFQKKKNKAAYHFFDVFSYLCLSAYRVLRQWLFPPQKKEYLLYLTERYIHVLHPETLNPVFGNDLLEYLILKLDERFTLLTEVIMPKLKGKSDYSFSANQFRARWSRCQKMFLESFLVSGLLSHQVRKSTQEAKKLLRLSYPIVLETDLSLKQKIIFEVFKALDSSSGYYLFRYFAARKYFSNSKLKAVIAYDENSPLTKSILDAAKFCGIKIVGLQHGTMHDLHPAYLYTANDSKNRVMPDLTLTWGTYWEEFLLGKGNYPKSSVVSVGQIRTDIIPVLAKAESQKQVNPTERIVFASQPQRDPELRFQAAFDVFKAVQRLPNTQLIVKLHPREFSDAGYYTDIAVKAGCRNYTIDKTSDLYQLIASCDVLITCFSTVGTETVYFHKPLVILDHLKQDIMGYAAEGVAFQATDAESLAKILSGIFRGTLRIDRNKYDSFIQKYAYRIDGKVAERCIEAITNV
jgi:CDP-glycerol glycerophosphotransferase (TagB/SpsB family)